MNRFLVAFLALMTPALTHGATYYVAKTGSDSKSCTQAQSASTPKLTIKAGLACLKGGDTLIIKAGTYNEGIPIKRSHLAQATAATRLYGRLQEKRSLSTESSTVLGLCSSTAAALSRLTGSFLMGQVFPGMWFILEGLAPEIPRAPSSRCRTAP